MHKTCVRGAVVKLFVLLIFMLIPHNFAFATITSIHEPLPCAAALSAFGHTPTNTAGSSIWIFNNHSYAGKHGGSIYVAKLSDEAFANQVNFSNHPEHPMAPEGGVVRVIGTLGPIISDFLGLNETADSAHIPDAAETNGAIEKINQFLTQKIAQRFYQAKVSQVRREEYVRQAANGEFPMAPEGSVMMHDVSYHLTALLLIAPEIAIRATQLSKSVVELCDFLRSHITKASSGTFQQYIDSIFQEQLENNDLNQGNVSNYLSASKLNKEKTKEHLMKYAGNGNSTRSYLDILAYKSKDILTAEERAEVAKLLIHFYSLHPEYRDDALQEDPNNPWCDQFIKRKKEIEAAIEKIESATPQ